jgi:hypothetical protein
MKKLALTIAAVAGASLSVFAQGQVGFDNNNANGFVVTSPNGDASSQVTGSYASASSFTVELWALSGPASTTAGLVGLDSFGYLNPADLVSDGFSEVTNPGNVTGSAGVFSAALNAIVPGTTSGNTVLAVVAWTGNFTDFASADVAGDNLGILAFVNAIGPASPTPFTGDIAPGWNALANSPQSAANGGSEDLILSPVSVVPEPTTLALAGLGGAALLAFRRRKA